ncbi:MAG: Spy/CpxP family protein refolding chaperone [Gemmatimonadaceae bacterium]
MRKILIITGLGMALSLGGASVASAQASARPERSRGAQQDSSFRRGRGGPGGMLLKGITLNADQKAKVTAIHERQRAQFDAQRKTAQARPERQRGDTTGFGARRAEMAQRRTAQVTELRSILNASQRTQFEKNVTEMKSRVAKDGRDGDGKKQGRKPGNEQGSTNQSR